MPKQTPVLLWLRRDLRIDDHAALRAAAEVSGGAVVPVFIFEENDRCGGAAQWWLYESLKCIDRAYKDLGARLILRRGDPFAILSELAQKTQARNIFWSRLYAPDLWARDLALKARLEAAGLTVHDFHDSLLVDPRALKNKAGSFFRVFTPFSRACAAFSPSSPLQPPRALTRIAGLKSEDLKDADFTKTLFWAEKLTHEWRVGSLAGREQLRAFLDQSLKNYPVARDFPARAETSRLSPYLAWGQITISQIWAELQKKIKKDPSCAAGAASFWREILWREFSAHLFFHNPTLDRDPLDARFKVFPWKKEGTKIYKEFFDLWTKGQTGYPLVDAGMRQLWKTGWMHNRVRMIVASFLVKDMGLSWRDGADWFKDTLVDWDAASNAGNWQWVAGCGADAAPFFRIFNPVLQSQKFDPEGTYIRTHVPELSGLSQKEIHAPWRVAPERLAQAGIVLGQTYPHPCLDHKTQREKALKFFRALAG